MHLSTKILIENSVDVFGCLIHDLDFCNARTCRRPFDAKNVCGKRSIAHKRILRKHLANNLCSLRMKENVVKRENLNSHYFPENVLLHVILHYEKSCILINDRNFEETGEPCAKYKVNHDQLHVRIELGCFSP